MIFEPDFFEAEEREGFHVRSMVKRSWAAQMEVLNQIDIVCKRHGIKYFATAGTLLGAVRHKGFIPWDDDVDISMQRKELKKFLYYAEKELPSDYCVRTVHNTEGFRELLVRVFNSKSLTTNIDNMHRFYGCPYIVGVDIFIHDDLPLTQEELDIQIQLLTIVNALGYDWEDDTSVSIEEKMELLDPIEELCGVKIDRERPIMGQLLSLSDYICAMYEDDKAEEVAIIPKLVKRPGYRLPKSLYAETIELPFENIMIPAPAEYDKALSIMYGKNYMTPREYYKHKDPFYEDQRKFLIQEMNKRGIKIPDFFEE
ncbi:MAG: LicD family protein [Lachnospiraceae bacterium]|nr:LicD family protein [Lachnospiraceae bacterium]